MKNISVFNNRWANLDEFYIAGDVIEHIKACLVREPGAIIYIGSDAQQHSKKVDFVTVAVLYDPTLRNGGRGFSTRNKVPKDQVKNIWTKLYTEVQLSLELACALVERGVDSSKIEVHIDANQIEGYKSTPYAKTLAGMVIGSGFKTRIKPDAWAASYACERLVKGRHLPTKERRSRRRAA